MMRPVTAGLSLLLACGADGDGSGPGSSSGDGSSGATSTSGTTTTSTSGDPIGTDGELGGSGDETTTTGGECSARPIVHETGASYGGGVDAEVADIDGDGAPDIVTAESVIRILVNDGAGAFTDGAVLDWSGVEGLGPNPVASVGSFTTFDGRSNIFINLGDGTFRADVFDQGSPVRNLRVADFSADDVPDLMLNLSGFPLRVKLGSNQG